MESFLPAFKEAIKVIQPVLETNNFCFYGIEERPLVSTTHLKPFIEDLNAEFIRGAESISLGCVFSQKNKLILIFSYYNSPQNVTFDLDLYATDNKLHIFTDVPMVRSYDEGAIQILNYVEELKKLLETTLMVKINDGTIDNHYYRIHDQYR